MTFPPQMSSEPGGSAKTWNGADYLSAFSRHQLEAISFGCLELVSAQAELLMWFWGLWLFLFALLTMRSGFLPKFLGVLLIVSGVAYVASCVTAVLFHSQVDTVSKLTMPLYFGEFIVILSLASRRCPAAHDERLTAVGTGPSALDPASSGVTTGRAI